MQNLTDTLPKTVCSPEINSWQHLNFSQQTLVPKLLPQPGSRNLHITYKMFIL